MTKHSIANVFKAHKPKPETAMDKTTRVVRVMVDEEKEKRQAKTTRLRNARLEREANTPPVAKPKAKRKAPRS